MRPGSRPSPGIARVTLAAGLTLLALVAPWVVVCEGAGHSATEWIFSSCCAIGDLPIASGPVPARSPAPAMASEPGGRCSDACEDTFLLSAAPEPSAPALPHPPVVAALDGGPVGIPAAAGLVRARHAQEPAPIARVADRSTVLRI